MMTTAKMREKARLYESKLDWANAALCWRDAIKLYPMPREHASSKADIANMESAAKSCEYMAKQV